MMVQQKRMADKLRNPFHTRMPRVSGLHICLFAVWWLATPLAHASDRIDMRRASVVEATSPGMTSPGFYSRILTTEVNRRTGLGWDVSGRPSSGPLVILAGTAETEVQGHRVPASEGDAGWDRPEGFRIVHVREGVRDVVWLIGQGHRGMLYAIGRFLSLLEWGAGIASLPAGVSIATSPAYALRGHQVGYRNTANSWDAWTPAQMERYILDLVLTGSNAIENIPFTKAGESPLFRVTPDSMNRVMSRACHAYGIDYWVWTPCQADLADTSAFRREVRRHADFYAATPYLDNVFVPGGDPGDNHPKHVMPFLKAISEALRKHHPGAGVWVSLQGFSDEQVNYFFDYLEREGQPDWLRGVVSGPGSPSLSMTRYRLHPRYRHRHYADITHNVRCELPVIGWDQAFALTLGREASNPRPVFQSGAHARWARFTDGFLSYSDGVHDDVNKFVWTRRAWDPQASVDGMMQDYARFHFGAEAADEVAEGILALERNWAGPVEENGGIGLTLRHWTALERRLPARSGDWRWQLLVLRARYDAWQKGRKAYEQGLERAAMTILEKSAVIGTDSALRLALAKVQESVTRPYDTVLRAQIVKDCERLHASIGLQTSVTRHRASGSERGAILDHLDHPLNNRWWLEDEFRKIAALKDAEAHLAAIRRITEWENPGDGSYYDDVSNSSASPRVKSIVDDATDFLWENDGRSRRRLSTQTYQNFPVLEYTDLDPRAKYILRVAGYGDALLRIDGRRIEPVLYGKGMEEFKEFLIDPRYYSDGEMRITFDEPEESHLNWRQHSKVSDVWLIRRGS
jgi:hypothetical protein